MFRIERLTKASFVPTRTREILKSRKIIKHMKRHMIFLLSDSNKGIHHEQMGIHHRQIFLAKGTYECFNSTKVNSECWRFQKYLNPNTLRKRMVVYFQALYVQSLWKKTKTWTCKTQIQGSKSLIVTFYFSQALDYKTFYILQKTVPGSR